MRPHADGQLNQLFFWFLFWLVVRLLHKSLQNELGPSFSPTVSGHRTAMQGTACRAVLRIPPGGNVPRPPRPSPTATQSNYTIRPAVTHTPMWHLYRHEGGGLGGPRVPSPLPLPGHAGLLAPHLRKHHRCPGATDAQAPSGHIGPTDAHRGPRGLPIGRVHTAAAHPPKDPQWFQPASPSDFYQ
jgi:hypothetical protein